METEHNLSWCYLHPGVIYVLENSISSSSIDLELLFLPFLELYSTARQFNYPTEAMNRITNSLTIVSDLLQKAAQKSLVATERQKLGLSLTGALQKAPLLPDGVYQMLSSMFEVRPQTGKPTGPPPIIQPPTEQLKNMTVVKEEEQNIATKYEMR